VKERKGKFSCYEGSQAAPGRPSGKGRLTFGSVEGKVIRSAAKEIN
jgi:hypothetical protein